MRDKLPAQPTNVETGIINLDDASGEGTHKVSSAIDPGAIVYFDLYGLAPPDEFMRNIQQLNTLRWYSTLLTKQKMTHR